jgi:hypothetical protein
MGWESGKSGVCINGISMTFPVGNLDVLHVSFKGLGNLNVVLSVVGNVQVNTSSLPSRFPCMVICNVRICCTGLWFMLTVFCSCVADVTMLGGPVTTASRVFGSRTEGQPPAMEGSCQYSQTSVHERLRSRTIQFTNKFSEHEVARMTYCVSGYEHASPPHLGVIS